MALINEHFLKLPGNYLFADIAKKVNAYKVAHPEQKGISLGIGDVTQPLCPAVIEAMHKATDEMAKKASFRGYGPERGYDFLREAIIKNDFLPRGIHLDMNEIFVNDGAKSDTGNFQEILRWDNNIGVTDPVYPVYIDSNVMIGRAGVFENGQWSNVTYIPCTADNNFIPKIPDHRVDMIYLCYPNNPTGTVLTKEELRKWVNYAIHNDSIILYDAAYQAYIRVALMMSYILVFFVADRIKILQETKLDNRYEKKVRLSKVQITVGGMAIILLISTCGYFVNATTNWFTGFPLKNKYQTLNATAYLENAIPEDAAAIRWLNKNITGQPTVLEACGDSYKDYDNRVSAMTGLPTVLGWYVHEWLWRNNLDEENKRRTDVETIYTSTDKKEVQELLDKYEVNYIFIGSCEYQKYEGVNVALLSSLGEIVFKEENTMIVKL